LGTKNGYEVRVRGLVQGVGFRPFVWRLAGALGMRGTVRNDAKGVLIQAAGERFQSFLERLESEAPELSRIDGIDVTPIALELPDAFEITPSGPRGAETVVAPDAATCPDCVAEIHGTGRRRDYAFTNCTNCGPRFSILQALPYDRSQTTMAAFEMCADCRAEYEAASDRRFHAQPIACPACGPSLSMRPPSDDPLGAVADLLRAGAIVAIKGLGGFHIACDATNAGAIAELRRRKHRPSKPLALMGTPEMAKAYTAATARELARLADPAAPIVLLQRGDRALPDGIAPYLTTLGWMLPHTPLHHLLFDRIAVPLVMTSGNLSGEPQVIGNAEAEAKLGPIADAILFHDRDIARRLDDSVERLTPRGPVVLRHGRGRAPGTRPLPEGFGDAPDVVAYGAHLKSAICLTKNGQALLSHHLGDLDDLLTWEEFLTADRDYAALFDHGPVAVACDLHPDYRSSRHAAGCGLPLIEVQHHHAHLAACLAENGWPRNAGKVAGIVLDGLGLGTDGTIWGGEILLGDYSGFDRTAWLKPAPLPGGDAANRDPWRNLLARLDQAGLAGTADALFPGRPRDLLRQAVAAGVNAPGSSSAGRLFDAFAAALGFEGTQSFEGEAAMWLEALAGRASAHQARPYPFFDTPKGLDPAPTFAAWQRDRNAGIAPELMALRFHTGLAEAFAAKARSLVEGGRAKAVALSGGCFQNALLLELVVDALEGLPVLCHRHVPSNDGGLALGQAVVALARLDAG